MKVDPLLQRHGFEEELRHTPDTWALVGTAPHPGYLAVSEPIKRLTLNKEMYGMEIDPQQIEQMMDTIGPLVFCAIFGASFLFYLAILAAICLFLSSCLKRIPEEHHKLKPGLVWLLMIPCFNIVWNFFVYPALADSYTAAFESQGSNSHGDCGRTLSLVYCILVAVSAVAGIACGGAVSCLLIPASWILLILILIKAGSLKSQLIVTQAGVYRDGGF